MKWNLHAILPILVSATLPLSLSGQAPVEGARYAILSRISSRAASIDWEPRANDGANVFQSNFLGSRDDNWQNWRFEPVDDGYYRIRSVLSGHYLSVNGEGNGASAFQQARANTDRQLWRVERLDNGFYSIVNKSSGRALEVFAGYPGEGANVVQWDYHGNENQQWRLYSAELNLVPGDAGISNRQNLGRTVNTECDELSPEPTLDGTAIYFRLHGCGRNVEGAGWTSNDIWYAPAAADGTWEQAVPVGELNNNQRNEPYGLSADGNTMLVRGAYGVDGRFNINGASLTHRTRDGWTRPEAQVIENYYSMNDDPYFLLLPNGKGIMMSAQRADSYGSSDLYISFRQGDNTWSEPQNMGMGVNSPGFEFSPYLAADGRTLYFASWTWPGYGSADMFVSRRLDDTWLNWSEARNMGPGVNTDGFDAYYQISGDGQTAYYASTSDSYGGADIFRVDLPPSLRPEPVVLVTGRVYDATTDQPISARIVYERLSDGEEMGIASANTVNGFSIALPQGERYGIYAEAEDYYAITDNIDLTTRAGYRRVQKDIRMEPLTVGAVIRLNNIFFDTGASTLRDESFPELNRLAALLADNPTMAIGLGGYTDNVGAAEGNLSLSQARSNSVRDYLAAQGIAADRLTSVGYGEANPVASNETDEGRQLNRRVEFSIVRR